MFGSAQGAQPEDRERHQRASLAQLDQHERDQQDRRTGQAQQRGGRSPTGVDGVDDRVDQQCEPGRHRHRARQVERPAGGVGTALDQRPGRHRCGGETDRHVDEQHPAPAQPAGQDPPSSTPAAPPAPATAPQIPSARLRSDPSANVVVMIDSAAGETIAAPRPWMARAAISHPSDWAMPPASEATREQHQADHEHAAAAEQVGHPPAQQQEAAERERVGVHDPRQVGACEVQVLADRGQRHVHDRRVDHDHELGHRQQQQGEILGSDLGALGQSLSGQRCGYLRRCGRRHGS